MTRSDLELTLTTGPKGSAGDLADDEQPLRFLVLSRLSENLEVPESFRTHRVSFDNFDQVLERVSRSYTSLDQFHPDFLVDARPELSELRDLGRQLKNPATRAAAAERLAVLAGNSPATASAAPATPPASANEGAPSSEGNDQLLSRLLGRPRSTDVVPPKAELGSTSSASGASAAVDRLVQEVVQSSNLTPVTEQPDTSADAALVRLLTERCRSALWTPGFRALERAWRSVHFLVSRFEADQGEVHVLDLSKTALAAHLAQHGHDLDTSPLVQLLAGDELGFDFIVADYTFELSREDLTLVGNLGALAARVGAPLLAHGDLSLAGCETLDDAASPASWSVKDPELGALLDQVRAHPAAKWIGLAAPRFVLRHPYGKRSDPIDSFAFEELPERPTREHFSWANPAFACAWLQGQAHARGGARWPLQRPGEVRDLPMPPYHDGSGEAMQPPLEALLSDSGRALAEQRGLIVFSGSQHQNRIVASALHAFASA